MVFRASCHRLLTTAACSAVLLGCADDGESGEAPGGSGGGSGQAGSSALGGTSPGGSAGGSHLPDRGSVSIDFRATGDCSGQSMMIHAPENGATPPVSAIGVAAFMTDDGFTVNHSSGVHCIVHQMENGRFMFDGSIFFDRPQRFSLGMYCHDAALGDVSAGGFTLVHPELPVNYGTQAEQPAQFEFFELSPGRVWGKLTIPALPNFDDDSLCSVAESYFAFEDCALSYQ